MKVALEVVVMVGVVLAVANLGRAAGLDAAEKPARYVKDGEISEPQVKDKVAPEYPEEARKQRIEGAVVLDIVISQDGSVGEIETVESPHELLTEAATQAVKQWRYEPGRTPAGRPVAVIYTVTVKFRLS